jgi:hypothetical protein
MESYDLLQCIDRVLDDYGSSAKQAVYLILALRKGIPYESIIKDPSALTAILQEVFDESSNIVKMAIAKEIMTVFDLGKDVDSSKFEETFELARRQIPGNFYQ